MHALLLGVVVTRLRATYGSIDDARVAWLMESEHRLQRTNLPDNLKTGLLVPTTAIITAKALQSLAREQHLLVSLLVEYIRLP